MGEEHGQQWRRLLSPLPGGVGADGMKIRGRQVARPRRVRTVKPLAWFREGCPSVLPGEWVARGQGLGGTLPRREGGAGEGTWPPEWKHLGWILALPPLAG